MKLYSKTPKKQVLYISNHVKKKSVNEYITSITCEVSKNIIKGEYSIVSEGQNILIQPGNSIKFTVGDSIGGMFMKGVSATYDIIKKHFKFYFDIQFYDHFIISGLKFPYQIFLLGNKLKSTRLRNLEETYDYNISLPNCTAFSYLDENKSAIGNISCDLPDYIPAGNYSKQQSEGFDINPSNKLNIVFMNDYNVSKFDKNGDNSDNGDDGEYVPIKKKSNSSSKTWIIWLCIVIGIVIIDGIIITICIIKKKGKI